ncbi:MAG: TonB-dependent receptor domain-containing protein [Planctomycetota bacterium]
MLLLLAGSAAGGEEPTRLEEMLVTPARREAARFAEPHSVDVVRGEDLSGARAPRNLAEAIAEVPGVVAQRTAHGQGSPFLRALTGFRTLTLIDGVRLNHSAFRDGPNQYFATVDHLSLARMEVVRGPSSVLYGSDSMGGTVNLVPLGPERIGDEYPFGARVLERLASAERSSITRLEVRGGAGPELGFLAGAGRKVYGDLRAGDGLLRETGFDEWDGDARIVWSPEERLDLTLGYQRVSQDDVPRTHKTVHARSWRGTAVGSERKRELDQVRDLLYLRARWDEPFEGAEEASATISWQRHRETRFRVRGDGRSDRQGFTLHSLGLALEAVLATPIGDLTAGVDGYRDLVDSFSRKYDAGGSLTSEGIQGPVADDATYDLVGIFVEDEVEPVEDLVLRLGVRATYARADADGVADPVTGEEISIEEKFRAVTGSVRVCYLGLDGWNLYGGVSQAFRAPNLSDLTRFDSARSDELETPSPGLDPEHALGLEIGARADVGRLRGEVAVFHTILRDLIQRFPTGRTVDGDREVTKANVGDGLVRGLEVGPSRPRGARRAGTGSIGFPRSRGGWVSATARTRACSPWSGRAWPTGPTGSPRGTKRTPSGSRRAERPDTPRSTRRCRIGWPRAPPSAWRWRTSRTAPTASTARARTSRVATSSSRSRSGSESRRPRAVLCSASAMDRVRLIDILAPGNVAVGVEAADRLEILETLIDLLPVREADLKRDILRSVLAREEVQTTGIGYGIAIPHGRAAIEPPIVASVAITEEPVDYGSVDGAPVRIFILMVSRTDVKGPHVQALAHVARLLGHREFREALLGCESAEQVLALIRGEEAD